MKLLALDTATEACSAALWIDGAVHAHFEIVGRDHTQRLVPVVAAVMAEAGLGFATLDGLVCGIGPGSFAGVRIGVAFAKGVALAHDLPLLGLTSLALLAQGGLRAGATQVLAAIDARMGEIYVQAFSRDASGLAVAVAPAQVLAPASWRAPEGGSPWAAVGTGWGSYEALMRTGVPAGLASVRGDALPQAADAFALALPHFQAGQVPAADLVQPVYLRNQVALTLKEQAQLRASRV